MTITANSTSKTYGQTVTFAGTEFTTTGLVNGDTVNSVTLTSAGADPTATVAGSPYAITASAAVGTGLGNYTISLCQRPAHGQHRRADHHGQQHEQDLRPHGDLRRHRVHHQRPGQRRHRHSVTLTSPGAAGTATVAGSPYAITASDAVGSGLGNYTITYVNGQLTVNTAALTITANSTSKTYGQTVTFAGTEFTTAGLVNGDTVIWSP